MQVSYCAGYIRPLQNYLLSVPKELAGSFCDELLALWCATYNGIGYVARHGYGDPQSRSPASVVLGRSPLPDRVSGQHLRS